MNHGEERAELRGAVYRGDAGSLVGILKREVWPENALQLIGDGLLGMFRVPTEGIDEATRRCVAALWDRGWEGDADLAAGLEAARGSGPVPLLRPLPVDLEELAGVPEGDPVNGGGRIDLRTGDVFISLRTANATVHLTHLQQLAVLFAASTTLFPLDPSYEPERAGNEESSVPPPDPGHVAQFAVLQTLKSVGLVRPWAPANRTCGTPRWRARRVS